MIRVYLMFWSIEQSVLKASVCPKLDSHPTRCPVQHRNHQRHQSVCKRLRSTRLVCPRRSICQVGLFSLRCLNDFLPNLRPFAAPRPSTFASVSPCTTTALNNTQYLLL